MGFQEGHGRIAALSEPDWLAQLLSELPSQVSASQGEPTVGEFWAGLPAELRAPAQADAFEQAVLGARYADRVAFATLCGHQAAIRQLVPALAPGQLVAFCASEEGGAHPRAIQTRLQPDGDSAYRLTGQKRWATLSPAADVLIVIASIGMDGARNLLRQVVVLPDRAGVHIKVMPKTEFTPEIEHAEIAFDSVAVAQDEVLDGDGYLEAVKPFRAIEDTLIGSAVLAYNLRVALEHQWPEQACEELIALLMTARGLTRRDPTTPAHHLALAGWAQQCHAVREAHREWWQRVPSPVRAAWERDTGHSVAAKARELRRVRAWQAFGREV